MALTKDQKVAQVKDLTDKLSRAQSVVFSHYIGLTVSDVSELRTALRDADAEMKVGKKTLLKLALKEAGLPEPEDTVLDGAVACIFSYEDPLSGAQISHKFAKDHKEVALIGGIFEKKVLSKEETVEFAKMPGKDVLLATFVSMIRSPLFSFAGMCNSPLTSFARALAEKAKQGDAPEEVTEVTEEAKVTEDANDAGDATEEEPKEANEEEKSEEKESNSEEETPKEAEEDESSDSSTSSTSSNS